jgi:hypothetical protein
MTGQVKKGGIKMKYVRSEKRKEEGRLFQSDLEAAS